MALTLTLTMISGWIGSSATADDPPPTPIGVTLTGLDAHDGTIYQDGSTLYLVGTRYGCGYQWQNSASPFCGFGLWTSTTISGPWSYQGLLFDPNGTNPVRNEAWRITCNTGGNGCFNPRLTKRHDGVWLLYFNAPAEVTRGQSAGYYLMGCNAPAPGSCGSPAGSPHGSTYRMPMQACTMGGDFSIVVDGTIAYLACSSGPITIEQLDVWWANGIANQQTGSGAVRNISYLSNAEAPGFFKATDGMWVMTYGDPMCGYCAGTGTSYSVAQAGLGNPAPATTLLGVWLPPTNVGWSAPASGRRSISGTSCGGQPRTVVTVDGQPYQWIDLWYGSASETNAGVRLEPIVLTGQAWRAPADGTVWRGAIRAFTCE
jgi:hypothetical protein